MVVALTWVNTGKITVEFEEATTFTLSTGLVITYVALALTTAFTWAIEEAFIFWVTVEFYFTAVAISVYATDV